MTADQPECRPFHLFRPVHCYHSNRSYNGSHILATGERKIRVNKLLELHIQSSAMFLHSSLIKFFEADRGS